jgi:hypothetical protein
MPFYSFKTKSAIFKVKLLPNLNSPKAQIAIQSHFGDVQVVENLNGKPALLVKHLRNFGFFLCRKRKYTRTAAALPKKVKNYSNATF